MRLLQGKLYPAAGRRWVGLARLLFTLWLVGAWQMTLGVLAAAALRLPYWVVFVFPYAFAALVGQEGASPAHPLNVAFRVLYDPGLGTSVAIFHALGWKLNALYTPVAERLLLGAAPFPGDVPALRAAGVTAVVNMCAEWAGPLEAYARSGVTQLRLPTVDGSPPALADIAAAVAFIEREARRGGVVFVHCRCGMGRSAAVVAAFLHAAEGRSLEAAGAALRAARREVHPALHELPVLRAFAAARRTSRGERG